MRKGKFLLVSLLGVIAVVSLFIATYAFSQSAQFTQCTSQAIDRTGNLVPGDFKVDVVKQTANGSTTLTYSISSPTGQNANKFGAWVMHDINFEQGFSTSNLNNGESGIYLTPNNQSAGFPPMVAWQVDKHQDMVVWPNISINNILSFNAIERYKPEESLTTILLGFKNGWQVCGPIEGFTNPAAPRFNGNPIAFLKATVTMQSGCIYDFYAGETDNIVSKVEVNENSPDYETTGCTPGVDCKPCEVINDPGICEEDTGLERCPEQELGRPPLQSEEGGWCYTPWYYKYPC